MAGTDLIVFGACHYVADSHMSCDNNCQWIFNHHNESRCFYTKNVLKPINKEEHGEIHSFSKHEDKSIGDLLDIVNLKIEGRKN